MIISVDHGNKQIKTVHHIFISGLTESNTPPALGNKAIKYGEKYYSLSEQRIPYMRDKTTDERFMILTLFAVFQELETSQGKINPKEEVTLLIGLPPAHYGAQRKKFSQYFSQCEEIHCQYGGKQYIISFPHVFCYPQGYAAAMLNYKELMESPRCRILDIGGFTVDYLQTLSGKPDMAVCGSLENGIITFYNKVIAEVNSSFDFLLEEIDIDSILTGAGSYPEKITQYVKKAAADFADDIGYRFRERGVDLRTGKVILSGGGALMLRRYFEDSQMFGDVSFIEDVHANAKGYEFLDKARKR